MRAVRSKFYYIFMVPVSLLSSIGVLQGKLGIYFETGQMDRKSRRKYKQLYIKCNFSFIYNKLVSIQRNYLNFIL